MLNKGKSEVFVSYLIINYTHSFRTKTSLFPFVLFSYFVFFVRNLAILTP